MRQCLTEVARRRRRGDSILNNPPAIVNIPVAFDEANSYHAIDLKASRRGVNLKCKEVALARPGDNATTNSVAAMLGVMIVGNR
jgi:hypothetical protein